MCHALLTYLEVRTLIFSFCFFPPKFVLNGRESALLPTNHKVESVGQDGLHKEEDSQHEVNTEKSQDCHGLICRSKRTRGNIMWEEAFVQKSGSVSGF